MLIQLIKIFWLLLPAGLANMAPVYFKKVPFLDYPIDFGYKFKGQPILGENKKYRGLFFGILIAISTVYIQKLLYPKMIHYSFIDYSTINVFLLGFLLGFGALFGDCVASFFKRRIGIQPGKPWMPFDQIDWIIGALIFVSFYIKLSWELVILALFLFSILHMIVNHINYLLKIQDNKF